MSRRTSDEKDDFPSEVGPAIVNIFNTLLVSGVVSFYIPNVVNVVEVVNKYSHDIRSHPLYCGEIFVDMSRNRPSPISYACYL